MKKIIIVLFAVIILLSFSSCADENAIYTIKDALKISAWVLNENIDANGYWTNDESTALIVGHGYWTENSTGRIITTDDDDVFVLDRLKLNEARIMAPLSYFTMSNINIFIEFDGIIGVEADKKYIQLAYLDENFNAPEGGIYGNFKYPLAVYANVCPKDEYTVGTHLKRSTAHVGKEYYLDVNAYDFGNEESPVIRARLKLAVIEDKGITLDEKDNIFGIPYDKQSRFLSIELVSYEYSDRYRLIDEMLWDEDD